jgi:hypothetical protein
MRLRGARKRAWRKDKLAARRGQADETGLSFNSGLLSACSAVGVTGVGG